MNETQLYELADKLSLKWWGVKYDGIIELKNRRWKNINGRFFRPLQMPGQEEIPPIIQMCSKRNSDRTPAEVEGTLLHELVHWRLWSLGLPNKDYSKEFVYEIIRVGAPVSGTKRARDAYKKYKDDYKT